jgi:hypothetical protein
VTTYPHPRPRRADVTHRVERLRQGALTLVTIGALYAIWLSVGLPALPLPLPDPAAAHDRTTVVAQMAPPSLARIEAAIAARETRGGLSSGIQHTKVRAIHLGTASGLGRTSRLGGTATTRSGATPTDTGGRATPLPPGVPLDPRQRSSPAPPPSQQETSPPAADAVTQVVDGVNDVANQATELVDETRTSVEQTVAPAVDAATQLLPPVPSAPAPPKAVSGLIP